jgi:predicted nucleotidyltransferase
MVDKNADTQEMINRITDRIRLGYRPERIVLYGSYAYGPPHPGSDIDLLVVKDDPDIPMERRPKVRHLLRDIIREVPVSPVVYFPGCVRVL